MSLGLGCFMAQAQVPVFNNMVNDLRVRFDTESYQVGDEILLFHPVGVPQLKITLFSFEYWGENLGPNAKVQVGFYKNDGADYGGGSLMPSTPLWSYGPYGISSTPRSVLEFTKPDLNDVVVPDHLTWTVQFFDLGTGGKAGVDLYSPPVVGNDLTDYWRREGTNWVLRAGGVGSTLTVDFAATMEVPEPATWMLAALGLGGYVAYRARAKRVGVAPR